MRYLLLFLIVLPSSALLSSDPPHRLGCLPEDPTQIEWIKPSDIVPAPTKASVDHSPDMPPVGNQGNQGSCVAWATAYYYKTYQEWVEHGWDVTDSKHQFSPAFMYNIINRGSDNGAYISDGFKLLTDLGCAPLYYTPYNDGDYTTWPDEQDFGVAISYRGASTYTIYIRTDAGINQLKTVLQNGYNAVISIEVYDPFMYDNLGSDYVYDTGDISGTDWGGHAVCVVGFDDSKPTNDGSGAFKIVNSWGTSWGDNGYFWMSYAAIKNSSLCYGYAYYQEDKVNYKPYAKLRIQLTHSKREYIRFHIYDTEMGWGKYYLYWNMGARGSHPFPSHPIVFDITGAYDSLNPYLSNDTIVVQINDNYSGVSGTIDYVATDVYTWGNFDISYEAPASISSGQTVTLHVRQSIPRVYWPGFHGFSDRKGSSELGFQYQYGAIKWQTSISGIPTAPAIADMEGDGTKEIVIGTRNGYIYVIDGATGSQLYTYGQILNAIYGSPVIGDCDTDDTLEILFETGDTLYYLSYTCTLDTFAYVPGAKYSSPVVTNLDGDGIFEVLTSGTTYPVRVYQGNNAKSEWFYFNSSAPVYSSPAIGDVDGDGIIEVVVTSVNDSIIAVRRIGTGIAGSAVWAYPTGDSIFSSPVISDIDRDGILEVIAGSDDGYLYAIHGDGTLYWRIDLGSRIRTTAAIDDINGDSYDEIAVGTENALYIIDYAGNILQNIPMASVTASPVIFDADGDGDKDIVFGTVDSLIMAYDYTGTFLWSVKLDGIPQASPAIGDIDGDGYGEIVIGTDNGTLYALNSSTTGIPSVENKRTFTINGLSGNVRVILSGFRTKNFAISIYDLTGRKIFTTAKELKSGSESFDLKPEIPSGIYFLKLETEGFTGIKKFTLLK